MRLNASNSLEMLVILQRKRAVPTFKIVFRFAFFDYAGFMAQQRKFFIKPSRKKWIVAGVLTACVGAILLSVQISRPPIWPRILKLDQLERLGSTRCFRSSPELGYLPETGRCGKNKTGARVIANERRQNPRRKILLIGDSISDLDAAEQQTYVRRIQELLDHQRAQQGWEIWNLSVTGYNLLQEYRLLERIFDAVKPERIIVQVCANDFSSGLETVILSDKAKSFLFGDDGRLRAWIPTAIKLRAFDWLLYRALAQSVSVRADSAPEIVSDIRRFAEQKKVPIAFLLFPLLGSVDAGEPEQEYYLSEDYRELKSRVEQGGVSFFEAVDVLPGRPERYRENPKDNIHPNEDAHNILGKAFFEKLEAAGFFDGAITSVSD